MALREHTLEIAFPSLLISKFTEEGQGGGGGGKRGGARPQILLVARTFGALFCSLSPQGFPLAKEVLYIKL